MKNDFSSLPIQPCLTSKSDEWSTPHYIWQFMQHIVGRFDFDAAAIEENAICKNFTSDALNEPWDGQTIWLNPPYSQIKEFIKTAYENSLIGKTVVCLVPARTDTNWWHDYALKADTISYLRGRLKFGGHKNSAPFPSAVLIYNPNKIRTFNSNPSVTNDMEDLQYTLFPKQCYDR